MSNGLDRRTYLARTLSRLSVGLAALTAVVVGAYLALNAAGVSLARTPAGDVVLASLLWVFGVATPVLAGGSIVLGRGRLPLRLSYVALAFWGACAAGSLALHL